jgi:segregation and condensation protein B
VRAFAKSLKPPFRLSLPALETLAVVAYRQPVTVPEISEIRGVDSGGVIATLLDRKLITTAGRKAVIGRPILYKTSKEFLLRFGLRDVNELPSMEEFEKLLAESFQSDAIAGDGSPAEESLSLPLTPGEDFSGEGESSEAISPTGNTAEIADGDEPEPANQEEETETPAATKPE